MVPSRTDWIALTLIGAIAGCGGAQGPETVPVSGRVTLDGKPLEGADVAFMSAKSPRPAVGVTNAAGEFRLSTSGGNDGAIPGVHQVSISKYQVPEPLQGKYQDSSEFGKAQADAKKRGEPSRPISLIPSKYTRHESSGLTATVEVRKKNHFTFDLVE